MKLGWRWTGRELGDHQVGLAGPGRLSRTSCWGIAARKVYGNSL